MTDTLEAFSVRAERLLDRLFLGKHHVPKIKKENVETPFERWEVNDSGDWSTFDFERLTRLVILAHDECIRASICPSGPRHARPIPMLALVGRL